MAKINCKAITKDGLKCRYEGVILGYCMKHYLYITKQDGRKRKEKPDTEDIANITREQLMNEYETFK